MLFFMPAQKAVRELFGAFKAQKSAAGHEQRRDQPRRQRADGQCGGHQNGFVHERAFGHAPDHGQLAVGPHARHLLGVERQVIAQHARRFLRGKFGEHGHVIGGGGAFAGGHLGHEGHVIQHGGNVVKQGKQAGGHEKSLG